MIDFFKDMPDVENEIFESLKRHGLVNGIEADLGGQKYNIIDNNYYQQGQLGVEDGFAVPLMQHNDWQVPSIRPDPDNWNAKLRFAEGLKRFEDCTKEVGDLFKPYDMTRLEVVPKHVHSSYVETILDAVTETSTVRDPPTWLVTTLHKNGNRKFKISSYRTENKYSQPVVEPSAGDIVLSSNLYECGKGIFLSPAYYKHFKTIDVQTIMTATAYEVRYWLKGKQQTRYLSRSPGIYYDLSQFGEDTLVSGQGPGKTFFKNFTHTGTDFFFFDNEEQQKHCQYFQVLGPYAPANSRVYRRSSVWNAYKLVYDMNSYALLASPVFDEVYFRRGNLEIRRTPIKWGRNFLYRVKRVWVDKSDPTLDWIDKMRRVMGVQVKVPSQERDMDKKPTVVYGTGTRTSKKKRNKHQKKAEDDRQTTIMEPRSAFVRPRNYVPKDQVTLEFSPGELIKNWAVWGLEEDIEVRVELELVDFIAPSVDTHGRIADFRRDLDPWEVGGCTKLNDSDDSSREGDAHDGYDI